MCSLRIGGLRRPCWCSCVRGPKKRNGSEVKLFEELDQGWVWAKGKDPYKGAEYTPRDGLSRVRYMQIKKTALRHEFWGLTLPTCLTLLWPVGGVRGLNRGRDRKEEGVTVWKRAQGDLDMHWDGVILSDYVHYVCVYANISPMTINIYYFH